MPTQLDPNGFITNEKRVQLLPYRARPFVNRTYLTEDEIRNLSGTLALDVESYPNYFLAGFKHFETGKYIRLDRNFNPQFLSWLLFSFKTVGFNSNSYDLVMLWASYHNRNPEFLKAVSDDLIFSGQRSKDIAKKFGFEVYPLPERQHVDLFNVCPGKHSLKLYAARLHCQRIQDLPIPDTKELTDEEIEIVVDYNGNDLDVTQDICLFNMERLQLREHMSIAYGEDLMSKSDAQMAEAIIPKEVGKLNKRWVKSPEIEAGTAYKYTVPSYISFATKPLQDLLVGVKKASFVVQGNGKIELPPELSVAIKIGKLSYKLGIGGLHSTEENVAYRSNDEYILLDRDVVSYYPNIIINLNLYPISCGPNFINVYKFFKSERVAAKARKDFTKDKGLKILLNGMSGKFSDRFSKMRSPEQTIQMTVTGQLSLLMFIEMLECNGIEVISANTDGVVSYVKRTDLEKFEYWVKYWEKLTGFDTEETEYSEYFAQNVNNYFAVKPDGKVKVKGVRSEVGSQTGTKLDNNPQSLICTDAICALLSKGTPVEETIEKCQDITRFLVVRQVKGGAAFRGEYLGKTVRWYYSKNNNDCIQYVMNGNKVADSDGAMPMMDLIDIPDDLNRQYYIDKCTSILYDIGYLVKPKQVSFFD